MKMFPFREKATKHAGRGTFLYLVIVFLCVSNATVAWRLWYQVSVASFEGEKKAYPLIDPARHLTAQENYLSTLQPLRVEMRELVAREKEKGNEIAVYFEYLNTGANIAINPDMRIFPASLIKLPLAFTVMKKVERGEWQLDDKLVLAPGDQGPGFGELYRKPIGTTFTIEELLKALLEDSDNTAYNILLRNLTPDEVDETFEALGLEELFNEIGQITAKEYSRLFRALYTASYLNREYSQLLLEWLQEGEFSDFLSTGIPAGTLFPHKFGTHEPQRVYTDSGVVYVPERPYLITVLIHRTQGNADDDHADAARIMQEISESAYTYVSTR
jgi:beta-lactamase class A